MQNTMLQSTILRFNLPRILYCKINRPLSLHYWMETEIRFFTKTASHWSDAAYISIARVWDNYPIFDTFPTSPSPFSLFTIPLRHPISLRFVDGHWPTEQDKVKKATTAYLASLELAPHTPPSQRARNGRQHYDCVRWGTGHEWASSWSMLFPWSNHKEI